MPVGLFLGATHTVLSQRVFRVAVIGYNRKGAVGRYYDDTVISVPFCNSQLIRHVTL